MTEVWQAGKTYVPGALARPTSGPAVVQTIPDNPNFEDGLNGWTVVGTAGWSAVTDKVYDGTKSAKYIGNGLSLLVNNIRAPVVPGQSITSFCVVSLDQQASDIAAGRIINLFYDVNGMLIATSDPGPSTIYKSHGGVWQQSIHTSTAPAGTAFASFGISANADAASFVRVDGTGWYYTYGGPPNGLAYKAVQAAPSKSGATEPAWPATLGVTVVDNEVTWEAVIASQIVYTARPINRSGDTEPTWPTTTGGFVHDGTIDWEATTPQVTDVNCPHSKIVAIAASKVYAADNDIIRYSSTVNPLDWTAANDAGYIPFGLQTYGSNPVSAMNLYRSNLVAFNAEGFQMWQVDEDPASTALLDALPIGSTQNEALAPVANDLFFLSSQGVRTVGIAASSTNLQAGDVGMPIDPLVQEAMKQAIATGKRILSTYVPSAGQYWLAFGDYPFGLPAIAGDAPDGIVAEPYTYGYAALGGVPPYVFTITSGSLPDGLAINSASGVVTGTPTETGLFYFTVTLTDSSSQSADLPDSISIGVESFQAVVLADNPVYYLPLNETSGTVAADITGHGHTGTYVGGVTHSATSLRPGGRSALFNGVGQYVSIPNGDYANDIFEANHAWSAEVILKRSGRLALSSERMMGKFVNGNTGNSTFDLAVGNGDASPVISGGYYDMDGAPHFANDPTTIANETVFIACVTYDGTNIRLYVNGALVKTDPGGVAGQNIESPITIGGSNSFPGSYQFDGSISDASLYDYELSADRALAHAVSAGLHP